jgi:ATP adenylyltransferase
MDEQRGPEHLHAPWRMEYIAQTGTPKGGCIFCDKPCAADTCDRDNLIVHRGTHCFIILNAFPYNNGHLMVIPYQHTSVFTELPCDTMSEMMCLSSQAIRALTRVMRPDGFNMGMNIGRAAGAGIAEHLHLHIVPRWNGDTNFMPVVGNVRVLPEALEQTWEKVKAAFEAVIAEGADG